MKLLLMLEIDVEVGCRSCTSKLDAESRVDVGLKCESVKCAGGEKRK